MRVFDADRQEWAGDERETRFDGDQQMQAAKQGQVLRQAAVVLAVVGLCFLAWALGWKDEPQPAEEPGATQPTATDSWDGEGGSSAEPSAESSEETSAATPPPGYEVLQDSEGSGPLCPLAGSGPAARRSTAWPWSNTAVQTDPGGSRCSR